MSSNASIYIDVYWNQFEPIAPQLYCVALSVYLILFVFAVPVDIIAIVYYCRCMKIRKSYNFLIINLMVVNLVNILNTPLSIINSFYGQWVFKRSACYYYGMICLLNSYVSISTMAMISFERFLVIKYPFKRFESNTKSTVCMILASWVYGFVFAILPLFTPNAYVLDGYLINCTVDYTNKDRRVQIIMLIMVIFGFCIPFSVIAVFSSLTLLKVNNKNKNLFDKYGMSISTDLVKQRRRSITSKQISLIEMHPLQRPPTLTTGHKRARRTNFGNFQASVCSSNGVSQQQSADFITTETQVKINLTVVIFSFCIAYLPYAVNMLLAQSLSDPSNFVTPKFAMASALFSTVSLAVNPIVYASINKECLRTFKRYCLCKVIFLPKSLIATVRINETPTGAYSKVTEKKLSQF
jgi:hypothetical protein